MNLTLFATSKLNCASLVAFKTAAASTKSHSVFFEQRTSVRHLFQRLFVVTDDSSRWLHGGDKKRDRTHDARARRDRQTAQSRATLPARRAT